MAHLEEPLDLASVEAPVPAWRRESLHSTLVRPAAERVGVDAEQARSGTQGQSRWFRRG
jgi:hypothetical protein